MLSIKSLSVDIEKINILRDVTFDVVKFSSVIGRNGAGKTTLIRSIINILPAIKGNIIFQNNELSKLKPHEISSLGIGYMPEDRRLIPDLSVKDNILIPLWANKKNNIEEELEKILTFIPEVKDLLLREAFQLSGGQQKLVALARAMIVGKNLLLLDEPFEGVAPALADRLVELIESLSRLNITTLITESDETYSKRINAKIIKLERGKIL